MPNDNEAQPQKPLKSVLRKPNSPKITGKRVKFDEANLRANREAGAAKRLKSWEQKHPKIQEEYFAANPSERKQLIALYAVIQLYAHSDETAQAGFWDRIEGLLVSKDTQELFARLAEQANSWETCKDFLQDPGLLEIIEKKGTGWKEYAGKRLDEIPQLPAEKEMQSTNTLLDAFNKKHPDPAQEYYKLSRNRRKEMLREYLLPLLLKNPGEKDANKLKENLQFSDCDMILNAIASKVQGWETCKELLEDKQLQFCSANPDVNHMRGDDFLECAARLTNDIANHPKEKAFLDSLPKPPDPKLAKQNVEAVRARADALLADITQVDFNLLGSGSKEFDEMKKTIKEFKRFAEEEYHLNGKQEIPQELQKKLLEKTQDVLMSVKNYADYKDMQFQKDPARRNASGRQKHEQPRILKSVKIFEDMSRFHLEQSMTEPGREYQATPENQQKKEMFEQKMLSAKTSYIQRLASRQSKERMGKQELFNDQDKREATKEQTKQKKTEAPRGMKK